MLCFCWRHWKCECDAQRFDFGCALRCAVCSVYEKKSKRSLERRSSLARKNDSSYMHILHSFFFYFYYILRWFLFVTRLVCCAVTGHRPQSNKQTRYISLMNKRWDLITKTIAMKRRTLQSIPKRYFWGLPIRYTYRSCLIANTLWCSAWYMEISKIIESFELNVVKKNHSKHFLWNKQTILSIFILNLWFY